MLQEHMLNKSQYRLQILEKKNYANKAKLKLNKLLPEDWGMEIPVNITMSEQFSDPKYNPLDNDVILDEDPRGEELRDVARTYAQQNSISFTNIRKVNTSNRPTRFYDPSNFALSFMYADQYRRDIYTAYDLTKNIRATLNYNYSFPSKTIRPLENWRAVQDTMKTAKYLKFLKEVNINPMPARLSFRTDIDRIYSERQYRDINQFYDASSSYIFPVAFSNNFFFSCHYTVVFVLTNSLLLVYTSSTRTLIYGSSS